MDQATDTDGSVPEHAEACLKAAGARSVWRVHRPGESARTLKGWPLTPLLALKLLLGQAQPQRHARATSRLRRDGLAVPPVVRGPRLTRSPRWSCELELEHIDGETLLDRLRSGLDDAEARRLGAACGELVSRFLRLGRFNRDLKLSNLLVARDGAVWILDPVGVRRTASRTEAALRMLERLAVEPLDLGLEIPRPAIMAAVRRALRSLPERPSRAARRLRGMRPPR